MHTVRLQITGVGESARTENHTTTVWTHFIMPPPAGKGQ